MDQASDFDLSAGLSHALPVLPQSGFLEDGVGEEWTADDLLDKAERFKSYWGDNGGITVSGGEALMQIDFLIELFEKAHQRGINTCLDTSAQPFHREGKTSRNLSV